MQELAGTDLGLARLSRGDEMVIEDLQDIVADVAQFSLDLLAVLLDLGNLRLVTFGLLLLLDRGNDPPRGATSTDNLFRAQGEQLRLYRAWLATYVLVRNR